MGAHGHVEVKVLAVERGALAHHHAAAALARAALVPPNHQRGVQVALDGRRPIPAPLVPVQPSRARAPRLSAC